MVSLLLFNKHNLVHFGIETITASKSTLVKMAAFIRLLLKTSLQKVINLEFWIRLMTTFHFLSYSLTNKSHNFTTTI